MFLFPSTRTDYLLMNEAYAPLKDVHVRRAISYSIDRAGIVRAILFGYGKPANSFMPPQVPYYDPKSPGIQYNPARRRPSSPSRSSRTASSRCSSAQATGRADARQVLQQALKALKINVKFRQVDTSTAFTQIQEGKYQLAFSYWTMDIADPDELVTFAVDPEGRPNSFFTGYKNRRSSLTQSRRSASEPGEAAKPLRADPAARRTGRVHGVPVLAIPLRHGLESERLLRHSARELPPGGRLAFVGPPF